MTLTATFNDFMMEFAQAFDNPNRAEKAMDEFQTFVQGKLTADEFFASFEILHTKAKLNQVAHDAIVINQLKRALDAKVVMGVMHSSPVPTTYDDWKVKAIQVDWVEQQIGHVMKARNPQQVPLNRPWQPQQVPQHPQVPQPQPAATQQTHDWQGVAPGTHPGMGIPMDVSINNARCNWACYKCGQVGHFIWDCPNGRQIIWSVIAALEPEDHLTFAKELVAMKESDFMVEEAEVEVCAMLAELEEIVENADFLWAQ
ncbi:hypothetical protein EW145_g6570 [Phellinidium pouzarii]|uniref:CCHC-type domain-containing protein n=1 Tax=Phellinidium pouzarii TaxID=167371 RepID=A0A4S4KY03_9AGAM|nr:hypothetical protein EW145_g6570 [Phellinidium pouzarii]